MGLAALDFYGAAVLLSGGSRRLDPPYKIQALRELSASQSLKRIYVVLSEPSLFVAPGYNEWRRAVFEFFLLATISLPARCWLF